MTAVTRKEYKRLSKEEIEQIIEMKASGTAVSDLAHQFNSSERQIHRILNAHANGTLKDKDDKKEIPITQRFDNTTLQEHHLAWMQEEMILDPEVSVESLIERMYNLFGVRPSISTIWRHIKQNTIEKFTQQMLAVNKLNTENTQEVTLKLPEIVE